MGVRLGYIQGDLLDDMHVPYTKEYPDIHWQCSHFSL